RAPDVGNVEQTVLHDGRCHHATDLARRPQDPARGDVSLAVRTDRVNERGSVAVPGTLSHRHEDPAVGEDRRRDDETARKDAGARQPAGVLRIAVESPDLVARRRVVGPQPAVTSAEEYLHPSV